MAKGNKKKTYTNAKGTKEKKQIVKKQYIDMYYMLPKELGAKEIASTLLADRPDYAEKLECWEEAGVLELLVGEDSSIDMEILELSDEEKQDEFLQAHQIVTVYLVHTDNTQIEETKKIFKGLISKWGGILCSDTKDFMPILVQ